MTMATPLPASPFLQVPVIDETKILYDVLSDHPLPHMNEPWPEGCEPPPMEEEDEYAPIREILERYCGAEG